ncbi:cytosolic beta-glucosidase-like [Trichogramma pretiosum]|uniref:cytosolic beta-glucosidase-like n=1 Tax=Trichogramma pretiosum TaxID=7493 RepID=UPI0006C957D4|nr:cytosolic beta-glucosidase-like [Trichogramma pretiosum]XP_014233583.1 cytosolic beta-glucosidase-like [Trichogramma pretiosum]
MLVFLADESIIMLKILIAIFCILIGIIKHGNCKLNEADNVDSYSIFPEKFLFGTAMSSYQVEGAWNVDGKSESNWDHFTHKYPEKIIDKSNGDVSCDFYHKYKEDIQMIKEAGFHHFRFSLSWPRLLPTGYTDNVNQKAVDYYHDILDELEINNIIPFVTIYHWDHPQVLEDQGGWLNESMIDAFADYARFVFEEFGPRVRVFTTFNEPNVYCLAAYGTGAYAPGLKQLGRGEYRCMHNQLKAHALAYHAYDKKYREKQGGQIGIVYGCSYFYNKNKDDNLSDKIAWEFECGWGVNPIFSSSGDYPELMKQIVAKRSEESGLNESRLPSFTREWISKIRGSSDYFGLNHYTSKLVEHDDSDESDQKLRLSYDPKWLDSESTWLKIVPFGIGDALRKIKTKYNNPPVYITENGISDSNSTSDQLRIHYFNTYFREIITAIKRDRCDVRAHTAWSFLDSFEWETGYTAHFGLVEVDFKDKDRKRTPKRSLAWLKKVIENHKLQNAF